MKTDTIDDNISANIDKWKAENKSMLDEYLRVMVRGGSYTKLPDYVMGWLKEGKSVEDACKIFVDSLDPNDFGVDEWKKANVSFGQQYAGLKAAYDAARPKMVQMPITTYNKRAHCSDYGSMMDQAIRDGDNPSLKKITMIRKPEGWTITRVYNK